MPMSKSRFQIVRRQSAGRHSLSGPEGTIDLAPYFTVTQRAQGLRAERAGEYQRRIVNPVKAHLALS